MKTWLTVAGRQVQAEIGRRGHFVTARATVTVREGNGARQVPFYGVGENYLAATKNLAKRLEEHDRARAEAVLARARQALQGRASR